MYTIGIDLGGTRIKGILVSDKGEFLEKIYLPTNDGDAGWKDTVKQTVQILKEKAGSMPTRIGLSAPGLPNEKNTAIAYYPNRLQGLENFEWSAFLGEKTVVVNDAHAAIMAELGFGAAKGRKNVVMLTLGTGVGGGVILNGKLFQGLYQKAGHIGHMTVDATDFSRSILNMPGSIEEAIGNYSVEKRTLGKFTSTKDLVDAYRTGDVWASYHWLTSVQKLSVVLASLTNIFSPELIILGGGIAEVDAALFDPLSIFMDFYEFRGKNSGTPIVKAHHGDLAGAVGAASFAMMH